MRNKKTWMGDPHKAKKKFDKYKQKKVVKDFWNKEYSEEGDKFSLSTSPSADLEKFLRWLSRVYKGQEVINRNTFFIDVGCGNGRNSIYLYEMFGAKGIGYDYSSEAIKSAKSRMNEIQISKGKVNNKVEVNFVVQNVNSPIPCEDGKADLVVDSIVSHVLRREERENFKKEVLRVLSSGSYYYLKSLLLDDDFNAKKMIREFGAEAGEENSYIHPIMGMFEHVPTEDELVNFYKDDFEIDKIERSHAHKVGGRANKRRYIVMYLRKK